jgi:hypothetical protein
MSTRFPAAPAVGYVLSSLRDSRQHEIRQLPNCYVRCLSTLDCVTLERFEAILMVANLKVR